MKYRIQLGEKEYDLEVENNQPEIRVSHNGNPIDFQAEPIIPGSLFSILLEGKQFLIWVKMESDNRYRVFVDQHELTATIEDERELLRKTFGPVQEKTIGTVTLKAPMPGLITKVEVQEGDTVTAGQGAVIVEAMKMENEIKIPGSGVVKKVFVKEGEAIEKDAPLVEIGA